MEWTKESLELKFIRLTSEIQRKKAVRFFESRGITGNTKIQKELISPSILLMVIQGKIQIGTGSCYEITEIKLPFKPRRKFPREMMVSRDNINWFKRIVVAKAKTRSPFIALYLSYKISDIEPKYTGWKYAKEID